MPQTDSLWKINSWREKTIKQQPQYADAAEVAAVLGKIKSLPPLVFSGEIDNLRTQLAEVCHGRSFLLQGGDCAESFDDCRSDMIANKIKILLQMSLVMCFGARKPVVRVGRIAGQYAKPRSADFEEIEGVKLRSYRGDIINSFEADVEAREPDPQRLLRSYQKSAMTLNFIRAMIAGGFADLHHPEKWDLRFIDKSEQQTKFKEVASRIKDSIGFMGLFEEGHSRALDAVDFFTSHEGLILAYEESVTRYLERKKAYYNLGAHMLWIGDRTRQLDGAHIEYFRGIANPVGLKVGPSAKPEEIVEICQKLNPDNVAGKLVLIHRFGHEKIAEGLPPFIAAVQKSELNVVWSCDPMHGNTIKSNEDIKTRDFNAILSEVRQSFDVHKKAGSYLGGIHFELTGENVTECIGGSDGVQEKDLSKQYETHCDPRLNVHQSLEMAFLISEMLGEA
ncbi:3-deoxy-7-phosphoheptulonate synthase class II [Oligoflexaceae bacterium]|nr:3-deoxy-7-phosphoheptulonate synthase class II [Oligoflexaceae bacterium]